MFKKMALLVVVLGLVVLLAVGGLVFFVLKNLDEIVRKSTETILTTSLNVECTVDGADVDIQAQSVEMTGITIGNPAGFESEYAFQLTRVEVAVDVESFRTDNPRIRVIEIVKPDVIVETKGRQTNLEALMANADQGAEEQEEQPNQKQYVIDRLSVTEPTVQVAIPLTGGQTASVVLPDVEKTNIGGGGNEVTPAEALEEFIALVLGGIDGHSDMLQAEIAKLGDEAMGAFNESMSGVQGQIQEAVGGLGADVSGAVEGAASDAKGALEGAAGDAKDAVGGILGGLGGKKDDEEK